MRSSSTSPRPLPSIATASSRPGAMQRQRESPRARKEERKYDAKLFSRKKVELSPLPYEQSSASAHLPPEIANFMNRVRNFSADGSDTHSQSSELSSGRHASVGGPGGGRNFSVAKRYPGVGAMGLDGPAVPSLRVIEVDGDIVDQELGELDHVSGSAGEGGVSPHDEASRDHLAATATLPSSAERTDESNVSLEKFASRQEPSTFEPPSSSSSRRRGDVDEHNSESSQQDSHHHRRPALINDHRGNDHHGNDHHGNNHHGNDHKQEPRRMELHLDARMEPVPAQPTPVSSHGSSPTTPHDVAASVYPQPVQGQDQARIKGEFPSFGGPNQQWGDKEMPRVGEEPSIQQKQVCTYVRTYEHVRW